jgi:molecular chaperone DnaK
MKLTRAKFEQLVEEILQRTVKPCERALADAGISPREIDEVVLVGGSTRIPRVQQIVREFFGREPHKGVNPDEVVAIGAAVQGGILSGEAGVKDILLLDVTPLSLGIETLGGVMTTLIPRNTTIPTRKSETFSTAADNQPSVEVHVLQGERDFAKDNRTLGRFTLDGIPSAPRGVPQIEVTFDIDANGIVHVGAKDRATSREQKIQITASSGLHKEEVDKMVHEAESHAAEDKKRRALVELKNKADQMVYMSEKTLRENESRAPAAQAAAVREASEEVKKAMQGEDEAAIDAAVSRLEAANHKLAENLYQTTAQQGQPADAGSQAGPEPQEDGKTGGARDGVIDAEYVVDDKKN